LARPGKSKGFTAPRHRPPVDEVPFLVTAAARTNPAGSKPARAMLPIPKPVRLKNVRRFTRA